MGNTKGCGRTRNFATVVYPESAPENWIDIIRESHINVIISPLHENDIKPIMSMLGEKAYPFPTVSVTLPLSRIENSLAFVNDK